MIPPLRPRCRPRAGRAATWLALAALAAIAAGCSAPDPADVPVAEEPAPLDEPPTAETPTAPSGPAAPSLPSFGTAADGLEATVVRFEPATAEPADADGAVEVDARVAAEASSRAVGLMGVQELPDDAGMLFVYPDEHTGAFWMKDTLIALDIAFIAADGTVRAVLTMEPCTADPCPVYDPEVSYLAALEVPADWFATNGIGVGARASWSEPEPVEAIEQ